MRAVGFLMLAAVLAGCAGTSAFDRGRAHLPPTAAPAAVPAPPPAPPAPPAPAAPPPARALDPPSLATRALDKELRGDHEGAIADLRAAIAGENDPERRQSLQDLLGLLEGPR